MSDVRKWKANRFDIRKERYHPLHKNPRLVQIFGRLKGGKVKVRDEVPVHGRARPRRLFVKIGRITSTRPGLWRGRWYNKVEDGSIFVHLRLFRIQGDIKGDI